MVRLRAFLLQRPLLAALVVLAALCVKLVVPAGFMIGQGSKVLTIQICHDGIGQLATAKIVVPMKGDPADPAGKRGKSECAFSSLSMASAMGADPALLGAALAFILALGFAPRTPVFRKRDAYLRPPLRGPPALI